MTDQYGEFEIQELLAYLEAEGILVRTSDKWHWMSDRFPAHEISLRSASQENVIIIDQTIPAATKVIGEMDRYSAMTLLHEEAIYLHQGIQFQVEKLDWEEKKAFVREVDVDYFTDANLAVELKVMSEDKNKTFENGSVFYGDVSILAMATIFKKIRFDTHDNIGSGPIQLPPEELHTSSSWLSFERPTGWTDAMLTDAMSGTATSIASFIPLFVQCDRRDIHVIPQVKSIHAEQPTFFVYDSYPGGIGISERVFEVWPELLEYVENHVTNCPCEQGCPACIGPQEATIGLKDEVVKLLAYLQIETKGESYVI
jgi:DEAD/DEAH box helicase domain-containing protein